jgi:hypothetical protein
MRLNKYGFVGISHKETNCVGISGLDAFLAVSHSGNVVPGLVVPGLVVPGSVVPGLVVPGSVGVPLLSITQKTTASTWSLLHHN